MFADYYVIKNLQNLRQEKNGDYIFCMMFACFINFPAASAEPSEASDLPELEL